MALKDTIERLQASQPEAEGSDERVKAWQEAVTALYERIAEWLRPYTVDKRIALERSAKEAYEEATGDYVIDRLDIEVGGETVRLEPRATVVIGAFGRIDMSHVGSGTPLMLVLTETNGERDWSIVDPESRRTRTPLTDQSFESALDTLLSGYGTRPGPGA